VNEQDTCAGDSGGPLVATRNKAHVLVGVTSFGVTEECGDSFNVGGYTSIARMRPWLDAQLKALRM
jgi:protein C (activated)